MYEWDRAPKAVSLVNAVLQDASPANTLRERLEERPELASDAARELCRRSGEQIHRSPRDARWKAELAVRAAALGDDAPMRVRALRLLAQAQLVGGEFAAALDALDLAVGTTRGGDQERQAAQIDALRVAALVRLERYADARETARRCLDFFERCGDRPGALRMRMALADIERGARSPPLPTRVP